MEDFITKMRKVARENLNKFDFAGDGMYNLYINADDRLSFDNSQGMVLQIFPFEDDSTIWILNYHDNDHEDIEWVELDDFEKQIIYNHFMIDCLS